MGALFDVACNCVQTILLRSMMSDSRYEDDRDEQVWRPIPAFTWRGGCSPLLMTPLALLVFVAMAAPDDVIERYAVVKAFVQMVSGRLPWIANHAASTSYPQVATLIACLTVSFLIWTACVFFAQSIYNYEDLLRNQRIRRTVSWGRILLGSIVMPPALYFGLLAAFALPGDPSWARGFTTGSRAGLTALCIALVYSGGMAIGAIPTALRLLIDLDLRNRKSA